MSEAAVIRVFPAADAGMDDVGPRAHASAANGDVDLPVSDARLAERVQQGDASAFDELVSRHLQRALGVALRLLGQYEDAEDLVQDAFMAALEKIDTYDSGRDFAPWFYRILVNRCLNARKSRSRRQTVELPAEVASTGATPLVETERSELRNHLKRALQLLPERQRTIVTMVDLEGFSSPEIAEILGISDGTVRWHLHQARRVLREALEPYARRHA